jgi:uncharacterized cofD-like protein
MGKRANGRLPKVVVIGGGTGLSTMLRGLKAKPIDITAIVTVADDGGSSGILRSEMDVPPPGDIRNVMIALADEEQLLSKVLQHRFKSGNGLAGHSLGNLILVAMKEIAGDFVTGVKQLSKVLAVRGRVLPSSADQVVLKAEMEDGTVVSGESKIPLAGKRIRRVFLEPPQAKPLGEALDAIREADAIILGPGSLYTSIIPNLLVPGMARAVIESPALKIYVCNVMTQPGETDGYTAWDHLAALEAHAGARFIDAVVVNDGEIPREALQRYAEMGAAPVEPDRARLEAAGYRVVADRLVRQNLYLRHDAERLSDRIFDLIREGRKPAGA